MGWRHPVLASFVVLLLAASLRAEVVEGEDLWVVYPEGAVDEATFVRDRAPEFRRAVSEQVGLSREGRLNIYLVRSPHELRRWIGLTKPHRFMAAFSSPDVICIRLDLHEDSAWRRLDQSLVHEIVHYVIEPVSARLPAWLNEGLALHWTGRIRNELGYMRLVLDEGVILPRLGAFDFSYEDAGRGSRGLWDATVTLAVHHLLKQHGDKALRLMFERIQEGAEFPEAFKAATGRTPEEFEASWRAGVLGTQDQTAGGLPWSTITKIALACLVVAFVIHRRRVLARKRAAGEFD